MGRSTSSAVVPFKIYNNDIQKIIHRLRKDEFDDDRVGYSENGWTYNYDDAAEYRDGNKNHLYCDTLEKGELAIFVVNESEYAAGGDYSYGIFSSDEMSLLEFCADFGITPNITTNDIVSQTL